MKNMHLFSGSFSPARLFFALIMSFLVSGVSAQTLIDCYNLSNCGVPESDGTDTYEYFSGITLTSNAVYGGSVRRQLTHFMLNSYAGLYTSASGGQLASVKVSWNSSTTSGAKLVLYAKNKAYTGCADLTDNNKQGTLLHTFTYTGNAEEKYIITGVEYAYVALAVQGSTTAKINEIAIEWQTGELKNPNISFPATAYNIKLGDAFEMPELSNPNNLPVTYSSSNPGVAEVSTDGKITIQSTGTTTVQAQTQATETFLAGAATFQLNVEAAGIYHSYQKIREQEEIMAGGVYLLVNETNNKIVTAYSADKDALITTDLSQTAGSYTGEVNADGLPLALTLVKNNEGFLISLPGGYLTLTSNDLGLSLTDKKSEAKTWSLTLQNDKVKIASVAERCLYYEKTPLTVKNYKKSASNLTLYRRVVPVITISAAEGYGTFYHDTAYVMPAGLKGAVITAAAAGEGGKHVLSADYRYPSGSVVPALTPLLINGTPGAHPCEYGETAESPAADNRLRGTLDGTIASEAEDSYYYALGHAADGSEIGFYWVNESGGIFTSAPNRAYLVLPKSMKVESFNFAGNSTGILSAAKADDEVATPVFTLSGRRCNGSWQNLAPGIYLKNGRKVIKK